MFPQFPPTDTPPLNQLPVILVGNPIRSLTVTTQTSHAARRPLEDLDESFARERIPTPKAARAEENTLPVLPHMTGNVARWLDKPQEQWTRKDAQQTIELVKGGYFKQDLFNTEAVVLYLEHLRTTVGDDKFVDVLRLFKFSEIGEACQILFERYYGQRSGITSLTDLRLALTYLANYHEINPTLFDPLVAKLQSALLEASGKPQLEQYYYSWRARRHVGADFKIETLGLSNADLFRLFSEPYFGTLLGGCHELQFAVWWHLLSVKPEELFALPQWKVILVNYLSCIDSYGVLSKTQTHTLYLWIDKALEEERALLGQDPNQQLPTPEMRAILLKCAPWDIFAQVYPKGIPIQGFLGKDVCQWLTEVYAFCPEINHSAIRPGNWRTAKAIPLHHQAILAHFLPGLTMPQLKLENLSALTTRSHRLSLLLLWSQYSDAPKTLVLGQLRSLTRSRTAMNQEWSTALKIYEHYFSLVLQKYLEEQPVDLDPYTSLFKGFFHTLGPYSTSFWDTLLGFAAQHPKDAQSPPPFFYNFDDFWAVGMIRISSRMSIWVWSVWAHLLKKEPNFASSTAEFIKISSYHNREIPKESLTQTLERIKGMMNEFIRQGDLSADEMERILHASHEFERVFGVQFLTKFRAP